MFCKKCGTQVEDAAVFCPNCGNQVNGAEMPKETSNAGKEGLQKGKKKSGCLKYVLIIIGVFLVACIGLSMCGKSKTEEAGTRTAGEKGLEMEEDYISMIQTGYLGEFTDATVKDIFDTNFDLSGFNLEWTSKDMDGQEYVGFHAYVEGGDLNSGTTLLFKVCTDGTFQVSGYAEGGSEDFEMLQIADRLNMWYMNWYIKNKIGVDAAEDEAMESMQRLIKNQFDQISGSAVLYGASRDYLGDRGELCKIIDGTEPLDMTVTELINHYNNGILDIYTAGEESWGTTVSGLQYGYYGNTSGTYAITIEPDSSSDGGVFYLYEYSISDSAYYNIWTGSVTPNGDGTYEAEDEDGLIALKLTFDGIYMDIAIDHNDMDVLAGLEGVYEPASEAPVTADTSTAPFLAPDELRGFARENANIGKMVSFSAEVSMSHLDIYLLNVFDDNGLLQIQASAVNGLNLYDGDRITYTGVYNGTLQETNQLSFTTVSIELR